MRVQVAGGGYGVAVAASPNEIAVPGLLQEFILKVFEQQNRAMNVFNVESCASHRGTPN